MSVLFLDRDCARFAGQFLLKVFHPTDPIAPPSLPAPRAILLVPTNRQSLELFHDGVGTSSYSVFILLYMPCVATIGVIYKEIGAFWAAFSTVWSVVIAYSAAVTCYQLFVLPTQPLTSLITLGLTLSVSGVAFALLIYWGRRKAPSEDRLIEVSQLQ